MVNYHRRKIKVYYGLSKDPGFDIFTKHNHETN